jgi:hypothetical protein
VLGRGARQVDDLEEIGDLEGYIDRTYTMLIYSSRGYFQSKNCMRELVSTTTKQKPAIALVDPDASRGGVSKEQASVQLIDAETYFDKWGFGEAVPSGSALHAHLFAFEPIEWNRIGHFQDVTMRLIAERLLPDASGRTYVDRELVSQTPEPLQRPLSVYHNCSDVNPGAAELLEEVAKMRGFTLSMQPPFELRGLRRQRCAAESHV